MSPWREEATQFQEAKNSRLLGAQSREGPGRQGPVARPGSYGWGRAGAPSLRAPGQSEGAGCGGVWVVRVTRTGVGVGDIGGSAEEMRAVWPQLSHTLSTCNLCPAEYAGNAPWGTDGHRLAVWPWAVAWWL